MLRLALTLVLAGLVVTTASAESVPESRAADHVGKEVTIEGRVFATHASPLATVLAFSPNFAGFTATILAADRAKFPRDLEQRYRDKMVRVTGLVTAYRGKPEMTLREPSQLAELPGAGGTPAPEHTAGPAPSPSPDAAAEQTRRILALIEERLGALDSRLAGLEQSLEPRLAALEQSLAQRGGERGGVGEGARLPPLAVGAPVADVRALLGDPVQISRGPGGEFFWLYGGGRSVTFDRGGRLVGWTGF